MMLLLYYRVSSQKTLLNLSSVFFGTPCSYYLEVGVVALTLSHASSSTAGVSVEIHVGADTVATLEPDNNTLNQ